MRCLFVIDNLNSGGAQRQMINLAVGLRNHKHDVTFFCYSLGDLLAVPLSAANIPVHRHLKQSRYSPDVIWALLKEIKTGRYDVVLSYLTTPNIYSILASSLVYPKPKLIISERSYDPPMGLGMRTEVFRQLYRLADYVIVNSHHQRLNFSKKYSWMSNHLRTIYNGVDLEKFYPPDHEPLNNPLRLLSIGSPSPYKNGLCLIQALVILRDEFHLCVEVTWIGEQVKTAKYRAEYIEKMYSAIHDSHLESQWQWMPPTSNILAYLHQHDALVHPSRWEGLPNVVCEALAAGRPVLVSNTLDHPRLVTHGKSGLLFDPNDPRDLANAILTFHKLNAEERRTMGMQGRQFAQQALTIERMTSEYDQLFSSLVH